MALIFILGENVNRKSISNSLIKETILNSSYNTYLPDSNIICVPDRKEIPGLMRKIGQFGFEHHITVLNEMWVNILSQNTIEDPTKLLPKGFNHADVHFHTCEYESIKNYRRGDAFDPIGHYAHGLSADDTVSGMDSEGFYCSFVNPKTQQPLEAQPAWKGVYSLSNEENPAKRKFIYSTFFNLYGL